MVIAAVASIVGLISSNYSFLNDNKPEQVLSIVFIIIHVPTLVSIPENCNSVVLTFVLTVFFQY